ncbi:MAG: energy-coupling factor transporter ATPase [Ruminococcus sp.]|jgi:energy-coupling factor transport system ATP-binding protein|nr:energy-coupling factor transporter ATPase [Ruminococcus sp.]
MSFISASGVKFAYEDSDKLALKGITLKVNKGEFVALLGHNGCGKSTMAKTLNALLTPSEGVIYVDGMDTSDEEVTYEIRRNVGLVLQNPDNQLVASIIEEDVAFGPENLGVEPAEIRRRVDNALKAVGMYEYRTHAPHKLSGGQKQRVAIAGILAMEPSCIVFDEPTAMLDPNGREEVMRTIKTLKEKGITIVLITHYMEEAVLADRVIVMDEGEILIQGEPEKVFSQVNLLKKHALDVPQATELAYKLIGAGLRFSKMPLNTDECVHLLEEALG